MRNAWVMLLAAVLATAGCTRSQLVRCGDTYCPPAYACAADDSCALPAQLDACVGLAEQARCESASGRGLCRAGACRVIACGDGVVEDVEACDDGNLINGDGCSADCRSIEACGNGIVDRAVGEHCDDANTDELDGCRNDCTFPLCGDGRVDAFETCDAAAANSDAPDASCRSNCLPARCGDGVRDTRRGEVCDDGNVRDGDGCASDCRSTEICGNSIFDHITEEECDLGVPGLSADGCSSRCFNELPRWQTAATNTGPLARFGYGLAYDELRNATVLFGGVTTNLFDENNRQRFDDTWVLVNEVWTQLTLATRPAPREGAAMVYDPVRREVVLFGGRTGSGVFDDTWVFDGAAWQQRTPATRPSARAYAAITFDERAQKVMLLGGAGLNTAAANAEQWYWDGTTWAEVQGLQVRPPAASQAGLVYDRARGRAVFFGGVSPANQSLDQTWEWDGLMWQRSTPVRTPLARGTHGMAYHPVRQRVVVVGGTNNAAGRWLTDTWEYNGETWSPMPVDSGNAIVVLNPLVFDARRAEILGIFPTPTDFSGAPRPTRVVGYRWEDPRVLIETCELATQDADGDGFAGCADPDCWGRCTPRCPPGTSCDATAPHCGDGMCNLALEDRALCPTDCQ